MKTDQLIQSLTYGTVFIKLQYTFIVSVFLSIPTTLIAKLNMWATDNETYITWVMGILLIDWVLGTIKYATQDHLKFSLKENIKSTLIKLVLTITAMYAFEGVSHFASKWDMIAGFTENILRGTLFLYPFRSAAISMYLLSDKKIPPKSLMKKLEELES